MLRQESLLTVTIAHHSPGHSSNFEAIPSAYHIVSAARDAHAARQTAVENELSDSVDSLLLPPARSRPCVSLHARMTALRSSGSPELDYNSDANNSATVLLPPRERLLMHPRGLLHQIRPQRLTVPFPWHLLPPNGSPRASPRLTTHFFG